MDKKLYKLLKMIQGKPGLYLGKKSLETLKDFINGYTSCMSDNEIKSNLLHGFQEYIQKKYDILQVNKHWSTIILFFSPTEEIAFDKFYELFDKFLEETKDINIDDYIKNYNEEHLKRIAGNLSNKPKEEWTL